MENKAFLRYLVLFQELHFVVKAAAPHWWTVALVFSSVFFAEFDFLDNVRSAFFA